MSPISPSSSSVSSRSSEGILYVPPKDKAVILPRKENIPSKKRNATKKKPVSAKYSKNESKRKSTREISLYENNSSRIPRAPSAIMDEKLKSNKQRRCEIRLYGKNRSHIPRVLSAIMNGELKSNGIICNYIKSIGIHRKDVTYEIASTLRKISPEFLVLVKNKLAVSENARSVIVKDSTLLWCANNATRIDNNQVDKFPPTNWLEQMLLEALKEKDFVDGQIFPSGNSLINISSTEWNGCTRKAFTIGASFAAAGLVEPTSDKKDSTYKVTSQASEIATQILSRFDKLDNTSPLVPIDREIAKSLVKGPNSKEFPISPDIPKKQVLSVVCGYFAHRVIDGTSTELPILQAEISEHGFYKVDACKYTSFLEIDLVRMFYSSKKIRASVKLNEDAVNFIKGSPYMQWISANFNALANINNKLCPLNEIEYAVLEMIAGRKYTTQDNLAIPNQGAFKALAGSSLRRTAKSFFKETYKKYIDLGLINRDGKGSRIKYFTTPNARQMTEAFLKQFDAAAKKRTDFEVIDSRNNNIVRKVTPAQQSFLPDAFYWYSPPADGDCLFHALVRQFPEFNDVQTMRGRLAVFVQNTPNLDSNFKAQFVTAIQKPGEYTGVADSAIQMAARAYGIHIRVVLEDGSTTHFGNEMSQAKVTLARSDDHFFLMEPKTFDVSIMEPKASDVSINSAYYTDLSDEETTVGSTSNTKDHM